MNRTTLHTAVNRLHARNDKPELDIRKREINDLIEQYVAATGERPDERVLTRMADYLLVDVMSDQHKHQRNDEYPFHTVGQTTRRLRRQTDYDDGRY